MNYDSLVKELKQYKIKHKNIDDKEIINTKEINIDNCYIGVIENKFTNTNEYEIYIFVEYKNNIAVPLLYELFDNDEKATKYYKSLESLINEKNPYKIREKCQKNV